MGLLSRQKGKSFERAVAKAFREIFPNAKRTLTQQRDSGEAPDIDVPGWWVEAKHHRKVPIRKAFEQAVDEVKRAKSDAKPVAVTMDNRTEPLVTMRLPDFLGLLRNQRGPFDVSNAAHLAAVDAALDKLSPNSGDIETTRGDRIRAIAASGGRPIPDFSEPAKAATSSASSNLRLNLGREFLPHSPDPYDPD